MKGVIGGLQEKVEEAVEPVSGFFKLPTLIHLDLFKTKNKVEDFYDDLQELPGRQPRYHRSFLARHKESGEIRTIRMIPKKHLPPEIFQEDVEVFKTIFHPNIIHLYETLEDSKTWYFVADRVDLPNLYQAIPKIYPNPEDFDETEIALAVRTILRALDFIHKKGIAHTNLSYQNILVPPKRGLKGLYIVGFGTTRAMRRDSAIYKEDETDFSDHSEETDPTIENEGFPMPPEDMFAAPETRAGDLSIYEAPSDIWSLGIITYQLLTKHHPYEDPEVRPKKFEDKAWREDHFRNHKFLTNVSAPATDFLKQMLTYKDTERPTAEQAYNHEWLEIAAKVAKRGKKEDMLDCLENLTAFDAKNKLQQSARMYMATNLLQRKERAALDGIFRHLDKEGNDVITKEALRTAFERTHGKDQMVKIDQMLESVFDRIDTEKKGVIDYNQFIAAAADDSILMTKKNLRATFDVIDKKKTGTINAEDLKAFLTDENDKKSIRRKDVRRIIKDVDPDEAGEISFEEFCNLMMQRRY